jgi:hypothetical protein
MRLVLGVSIAIRLAAAAVLVFGPWTDSASELAGWDVARFQEIAEVEGQPWVDEPVEYPPASVALMEAMARSSVVGTHRSLVVSSLVVDGVVALLVGRLRSRRAATTYLALGLPLLPMGLLRFDLWAVGASVCAVALVVRRRPRLFGVAVTIGAAIKLWPALLVGAAVAIGRWRAAWWAAALGALAVVTWLGWAGGSVTPLEQVLSLRGATGWHVESVPGSLTALIDGGSPRLELNAYRIGTISAPVVAVGRGLTVAAALALVIAAARRQPTGDDDPDLGVLGAVMLGSVAALIVTAPLLSPQFLLWLTPWAALTIDATGRRYRTLPWLVLAATTLTGVVLAAYGPAGVHAPIPAVLLLLRDAVLVAVVVASLRAVLTTSTGDGADPSADDEAEPGDGMDPSSDDEAEPGDGMESSSDEDDRVVVVKRSGTPAEEAPPPPMPSSS